MSRGNLNTLPGVLELVLVGFLCAGGSISAAASPPARSLPELVRSALSTDESMASAASQLRRAGADTRLARSALLPRLELNGTYTRFQSEQAFEFAPGQSFVVRPLADWNWSADLTQTLFYGLRDWRARDVAREQYAAAQIERASAASDLALRVSQAFFDAVAARERLQVRTAALKQVEAQLRVAQRRFQVGELTSADVARWSARLAAERQAVAEADGTDELARRRLARLAGVDAIEQLNPPPPVPTPAGKPEGLTLRALESRPEMTALDRRLKAAALMIRVEKGAWLPELDAHLQYFRQKADFPSNDWASLALTLKVPIYDGGVTAARVAKAREDLMDAEILRRKVEKAIRDQVDASLISYRTAALTLTAAKERSRAAAEAYRQVKRAYAVGEATATDLLTATTDATDARTAAVIAHWQRELQAIALRHAVGLQPVPGVSLPGWEDEDAHPESFEKSNEPRNVP